MTFSKDPACLEDVVTFTCAILGTTLSWDLNDTTMMTYNANDTCGTFSKPSYAEFNMSFVLASSVLNDEGLFECTSVMTLSSSAATTVKIGCATMNTTAVGAETRIENDSHQLRFLGMTISNITGSELPG